VNDGKEKLNFSTFAELPVDEQLHSLHECIEMIEENLMPLPSYLKAHKDAILTAEEKEIVIKWAERSQKKILKAD
jgi:hypothetical protein